MSKAITLTIPHDLGRAEARRRIESGFGDLAKRIGGFGSVTKTWEGDRLTFSFSTMGETISGLVDVADKAIRLEVLLPGFLGLIASKVKGRLQKEGQLLLEKK